MFSYWEDFYKTNHSPILFTPSSFAKECLQDLITLYGNKLSNTTLLDIGCGNGRDATLFADYCNVVACDFSTTALSTIEHKNISKTLIDFTTPNWEQTIANKYDVCYCRFLLHALDYKYHNNILKFIFSNCDNFFIECRSSKKIVNNYYFGNDHPRWLVDANNIIDILQPYENIHYSLQDTNNLSAYYNENPFVIRLKGQRASI